MTCHSGARGILSGVTWQQRTIGAATLVVLMMVPATAMICAIVCDGGALVADHCHEPAESASQLQLSATPAHECGGHAALAGDVASPAQLRIAAVTAPALFDQWLHAERGRRPVTTLTFASTAPPGSDPPTSIPTVLRA